MNDWSTLPERSTPAVDDDLRPAAAASSPNSSKFWRWGTVGLMAAMVLGPVAARQIPREAARWQAAIALEARLDGRTEEALLRLQKSLAWDPGNATVYLQRAAWAREDGRYAEALEDCDRAIELADWNPLAKIERSQIYQHLGRRADAVADWKSVVEMNERRRLLAEVNLWNGLAYARAVAGMELDEALADMQRAVVREPAEPALLDTRGYLLYRLGKYDEAIVDLDAAVAGAERRLAERDKQLAAPRSPLPDRREAERDRRSAAHELAVIVYHRSLVFDKLNQPEAAAADRDRVRQLGHQPDERLF